jgi:Transposase DDE domain group 1
MLLRQVDQGLGLTRRLAGCFQDRRRPDFVDHSVAQLLAQRIYALALGYEDLNGHGHLRRDPLLAAACEKTDPLGGDQLPPQFRRAALAAGSTLNRLELSNQKDTRCHKLGHDPAAVEDCLLAMGVRCLPKQAEEIVLGMDATGALVHGGAGRAALPRILWGLLLSAAVRVLRGIPLWASTQTEVDKDGAIRSP